GVKTPQPVTPGGEATDIPVVLLIDEGTASSAEIFAGALQDHGRAKLVGAQTFGTGTGLQPVALKDGSAGLVGGGTGSDPQGRGGGGGCPVAEAEGPGDLAQGDQAGRRGGAAGGRGAVAAGDGRRPRRRRPGAERGQATAQGAGGAAGTAARGEVSRWWSPVGKKIPIPACLGGWCPGIF